MCLLLKNKRQDLVEFAWHQFKLGRTEATISDRIRTLTRFSKIADLTNPDEVFTKLGTMNWKNSTKQTFVDSYGAYCKFKKITYTRPDIEPEEQIPFIPTEGEIDYLISASTIGMATFLQLLKETGVRISEALKLQWIHFDFERKTVTITPSKGSNPRILSISEKLIAMLNKLPKRNKDHLFARRRNNITMRYCLLRKRVAQNIQNPRIMQIHFHTFRHWKGTMEYHKTKDIMHVKYVLGHKSIDCTLLYINIEQAVFLTNQSDQQWITKNKSQHRRRSKTDRSRL